MPSSKFKTFTGDDIWNALNTAAIQDKKIPKDVDVKSVAKTWIEKDRLPTLTVLRNYDTRSIAITQVRGLRLLQILNYFEQLPIVY